MPCCKRRRQYTYRLRIPTRALAKCRCLLLLSQHTASFRSGTPHSCGRGGPMPCHRDRLTTRFVPVLPRCGAARASLALTEHAEPRWRRPRGAGDADGHWQDGDAAGVHHQLPVRQAQDRQAHLLHAHSTRDGQGVHVPRAWPREQAMVAWRRCSYRAADDACVVWYDSAVKR